jgi:hypothetical protein
MTNPSSSWTRTPFSPPTSCPRPAGASKTASVGSGASFFVEPVLVVRERLPALGSHERVVVTAH